MCSLDLENGYLTSKTWAQMQVYCRLMQAVRLMCVCVCVRVRIACV